ncbi:MAG: alpha/beta fold hydrolase [Firmicutes bacterium]|nr:alpha/beta fold hydrolase [Bacillota bacterium]
MMRTTVKGVSLAYDDEGTGSPVVFVHAFPLNRTMWRGQVDALRGRWRAIAVDLRGFGESELGGEPFTMDGCADDVFALLDELGVNEPVVLVGLSMGGYVAFGAVRRHAHRLRALVLADTRAEPDAEEARAGRYDLARRVQSEGMAPVIEGMLPRLLGETTRTRRPEVAARVKALMQAASPDGVAAALRGLAERPDSRPDLARITVPTLVVAGEEDVMTNLDSARALHEAIPGSQLAVIPAAGHLPNLETPGEFNDRLLSFLDSLGG